MSLVRSPATPRKHAGSPRRRQSRIHAADLLLPAALALWALGVSRTDVTALGPYGLTTALPLIYYAGVALLALSAATELGRSQPAGWRMSLHAVALVVVLYGTAPLVYAQGRYGWLYKTIGVVQYVNAHGHLSSHIDIYQNWPGFFAFTAWFGKVAGVASPLAYAKWAQLAVELAALPLLYLIYDGLGLTVRQRWAAVLLYSAGNWIGQDYFSPQAMGTVLSLGIMAMAMRWLYVKPPPKGPDDGVPAARWWQPRRWWPPARWGKPPAPAGRPVLIVPTILLVFFVLTFTHELSPYMLVVQLGALAALRLLRPRWLPLALIAIAIGYLLPRFTFVNSHYGLLNSIGNFFGNAAPPAFSATSVPQSQLLIERSATALSVGMWGLAVLGAWLGRRARHQVLALVLLAFSPAILLAAQSYGHEGALRVYLFSLPWAAALAALAVTPSPAPATTAATRPAASRLPGAASLTALRSRLTTAAGAVRRRLPARRPSPGTLRAPLALAVALALFFPAFFGDDTFNRMPAAEVSTVTAFLRTAPVGPVYFPVDNAPLADTARYDLFPLITLFGGNGLLQGAPVTPGVADLIANDSFSYTRGREPAYVLVTPSMRAYSTAYGTAAPASFTVLLTALSHAHGWKLLVRDAGTVIYELPPTTTAVPPGARG